MISPPTTVTPPQLKNAPLISIITPAYNGAKHLPKLRLNLEEVYKNSKNIEWIIVDDASPDNGETRACIERISHECNIPIKKVFLDDNHYGALSTATGASYAAGEYIIILDQDDTLEPVAIEFYSRMILSHGNRKSIAGVCGRCTDSSGNMIGSKQYTDTIITRDPIYRHKYHIHGELLQCTRKEIILEYFSKMHPGNTNGVIWLKIAKSFDFVYTNTITRRYNTLNPTSVSNTRTVRHLATVTDDYLTHLDAVSPFFFSDPIKIARIALHAQRFEFLTKIKSAHSPRTIRIPARIIKLATSPIALLLVLNDLRAKRTRLD